MSAAPEELSRTLLPGDLDRLLHDLRGPLNAANIHVEVLRRLTGDDPAARRSLDTLAQEIARLASLLPAAFGVAALELGEVASWNLRALVERALGEHKLTDVTIDDAVWPDVRGDARLLALAIAHLVDNALASTRAAGGSQPPQLSARVTGAGVTFVVRDWGRGFRSTNPKALIRLAAPKGIGLITVERIARLHGGTLNFASPDEGAEVSLTLPAPSR